MVQDILASLRRRWQLRSLRDKILWPLVGLMLLSLLVSALAFVFGTALTKNQLVTQQIDADAQRVTAFLSARADEIQSAARLLVSDPAVQSGVCYDSSEGLTMLNSRVVVIRDRFGLHLVQIYNAQGELRANLVLSSLYRESSLLDRVVGDEGPVVLSVEGRLLLLSRAEMPNGGAIVTGIDLETELKRLANTHRLSADLFLTTQDGQTSTNPDLPMPSTTGRQRGYYVRQTVWMAGDTPVQVILARSTADMAQVTQTGLAVMLASSLITTLLLAVQSMVLARSISQPIHELAHAAEGLARGNLSRQVNVLETAQPFGIGQQDEIGLLATAFNRMVAELRDLYGNLEEKVQSRTHSLNMASRIARSVSASLNLQDVLEKSAYLIQEHLSFHHVGIFLIEPSLDTALLRIATSKAGQQLQGRGFRLPLSSRSLVSMAAQNRAPQVRQDVSDGGVFFDNSVLLRTASAAAFPLVTGEMVVGVLDVQSARPNVFAPELVDLLTTLADQIAIGVHNAQLYQVQQEMVEHLSEVDRLKNQFLAVMSHELRTPLNSIIGFSKILIKGLNGPLNDLQLNDAEIIHRSGQHLLSLINDILDISRINAGQMELAFEPVDLATVIENVFATAEVLVQDRPIDLKAEIQANLPLVEADGRRVRQILLNLLSNATKFTEAGEIVVRAETMRAASRSNGGMEDLVRVSVSDTGTGIPEDKLEHIFLEFTQVDASSARRYQGSGLGLSITRKLVELHGGRIWVESQLGRGTVLTFILPVKQSRLAEQLLPQDEQVEKEMDYVA